MTILRTAFITASLLVVLVAPEASAQIAILAVDDDGLECPQAAFTSIQDAVDAAAAMPGKQVIRVCAGDYAGNVTITGDELDILGDGAALTVIHGLPGSSGPIVAIEPGSRARLEDLTITGDSSALARAAVSGVKFREASGQIVGCIIRDIRDAGGRSPSVGIELESFGAAIDVDVFGNHISNVIRHGILANGPGVRARIGENVLIGPSAPQHWAPNGISILRGAQAAVKRNEIHAMNSPLVTQGAGSGIVTRCPGATHVAMNDVHGSDLGISLTDTSNALVEQNQVFDALYDAFSVQAIGMYFGDPGCPGGLQAPERNQLRANRAERSGDNGISIVSYDPSFVPARNTVSHNVVVAAGDYGLVVYHGVDSTILENRLETTNATYVDARDDSIGPRTRGTANVWWANVCRSSLPVGLCAIAP